MKRKKLFTNFFDTEFGRKEIKVARKKKGELVDSLLGSTSDMPEEDVPRGKVSFRFLYLFCFLVFLVLFLKLSDLQFVKGQYFLDLSKGNRIRSQVIKAPRGLILDNKGNPLVKNVANFQVIVEPFDLPKDKNEKDRLVSSLSQDLGVPFPDILKAIGNTESIESLDPKVIKDNLDQESALRIKIKYKDYPAVAVEAVPSREYLDSDLSSVLGYIGRISKEDYEKNKDVYDMNEYIGKSGLELSYENYLRGQNGRTMVEIDATGRVVRTLGSEEQADPKMGENIGTSLNIDLEKEMGMALKNALDGSHSKSGSVVAINPQNGTILGMVSLPTFDNNLFTKGISAKDYNALVNDPLKPLFNRSIAGTYPSGSIIKPVIASAALQEGVISTQTTINDTGQIVIPNQYNPSITYVFKGWKAGGLGPVNVFRALAMSSDIFFYEVGGGYQNFKGLGASRLEKYLRIFGLGSKTGVDLPEEEDGLVPNPDWKKKTKNEPWVTGDNYHLAIGQGDLLVTPLQVASYTATIANGGTFYKPRIVQKVTDSNGKVIKEFSSEVIRSGFIDSKNIDIVRQGMRQVVTSGTAKSLQDLPVEVAGKTGTAQYGPNNSKEHAWFTAFAPYNNPEIAVAVLVEGGGEGSVAAAPVAKQILEYYFSHK